MQVLYSEGVANRTDLESCVSFVSRGTPRSVDKGTGRPAIEPRKFNLRDADVIHSSEGETGKRAIASAHPVLRGQRTWHVCTLLAREPGELWVDREGTRSVWRRPIRL